MTPQEMLKSIFGSKPAQFIYVFFLGAAFVWYLPDFLITKKIFDKHTKLYTSAIVKGDSFQEVKLLELQKDIAQRQLFDLQVLEDQDDFVLSPRQNRQISQLQSNINKYDKEKATLLVLIKKQ